jgi:hypothetical protein
LLKSPDLEISPLVFDVSKKMICFGNYPKNMPTPQGQELYFKPYVCIYAKYILITYQPIMEILNDPVPLFSMPSIPAPLLIEK